MTETQTQIITRLNRELEHKQKIIDGLKALVASMEKSQERKSRNRPFLYITEEESKA